MDKPSSSMDNLTIKMADLKMSDEDRLEMETERLKNTHLPGFRVQLDDDDPRLFHVDMLGPENTPYEDGIFKLDMSIPLGFPQVQPILQFKTKVYHPNVDKDGRVLMHYLSGDKLEPKWNPAFRLTTVLISLDALMCKPNPELPFNNKAAFLWVLDPFVAKMNASNWTHSYAMEYYAPKGPLMQTICEQIFGKSSDPISSTIFTSCTTPTSARSNAATIEISSSSSASSASVSSSSTSLEDLTKDDNDGGDENE